MQPEIAWKYAGSCIGTMVAPRENRTQAEERVGSAHARPRRSEMLRWAIAFFIIAIVAAIFGFGGIAVAAAGIAKILFFIFLVLFLVALLGGLVRRV